MEPTIYLLSISLPLGTILLIFALKYWSTVQSARARLANDDAYRQLADKAAAAQAETAEALATIKAMLGDVNQRVSGIEKVLKEVE